MSTCCMPITGSGIIVLLPQRTSNEYLKQHKSNLSGKFNYHALRPCSHPIQRNLNTKPFTVLVFRCNEENKAVFEYHSVSVYPCVCVWSCNKWQRPISHNGDFLHPHTDNGQSYPSSLIYPCIYAPNTYTQITTNQINTHHT